MSLFRMTFKTKIKQNVGQGWRRRMSMQTLCWCHCDERHAPHRVFTADGKSCEPPDSLSSPLLLPSCTSVSSDFGVTTICFGVGEILRNSWSSSFSTCHYVNTYNGYNTKPRGDNLTVEIVVGWWGYEILFPHEFWK